VSELDLAAAGAAELDRIAARVRAKPPTTTELRQWLAEIETDVDGIRSIIGDLVRADGGILSRLRRINAALPPIYTVLDRLNALERQTEEHGLEIARLRRRGGAE
jgi:hypothetical protein